MLKLRVPKSGLRLTLRVSPDLPVAGAVSGEGAISTATPYRRPRTEAWAVGLLIRGTAICGADSGLGGCSRVLEQEVGCWKLWAWRCAGRRWWGGISKIRVKTQTTGLAEP